MDRIEAMKVFVAALDEGSLAGAGRRLGRSPAAVSRAIAFLESHVGAELLHRTTRTLKLSQIGEGYAEACRRVLAELEAADLAAAGEHAAPTGTLTITAPPIGGEEVLRPVIDAFLEAFPAVSVHLVLIDRAANLVEEGIDVALRILDLPDSSLVAVRIGGRDRWVFPPAKGSTVPRAVHFKPRLIVNSVRGALGAAVAGIGVTRLLTYHVAERVQDGSLKLLLRDAEPPARPVHLVMPEGRLSVPKVRAFVDFAAPRLKAEFARLSAEALALQP